MLFNCNKLSNKKLIRSLDELASPYSKLTKFLEQTENLGLHLPLELTRAILNFRHAGNNDGFLLLKNLLIDSNIPATPNVGEFSKASYYSEGYLAAIAYLIGEPYGYKQESNGAIIQNLFPSQKNQFQQSSESSKVNLEFHTEIVFHPFAPDFLLLLCLRQDPDKEAATLVSSIRNVLRKNLLSNQDLKILRQPLFKTGIDYSFGNKETQKGNGPTMACLYGDTSDPLLSFDLDLMIGLTSPAERALLNLKNALQNVAIPLKLEKGDLILIDNRRVIHGRTSFKAYFNGQDRWLQRCLVSRNLQNAEILFERKENIISFTNFENVKRINRTVYE